MSDKNERKIDVPEINLPKGGGAIKGLGETFQPDSFSGTGNYTIPFELTKGRGLEPNIALNYNSGSGNSPFGIGFSLNLEKISLRTETGIPKYNGKDTYLLNGNELVPSLDPALTSSGYIIQQYYPILQKEFLFIRHFTKEDQSESYWEVTTTENVVKVFGKQNSSRIYNPTDPTQIFEWLLESTIDRKDNKILYRYKDENTESIPKEQLEGRSFNNKYIQSILYGNYYSKSQKKELFAFEVVFDYGEYDLSQLNTSGTNPHVEAKPWSYRPDPFSTFTSGFEIRTCRRCQNVLLFHSFDTEIGNNSLVRRLSLSYTSLRPYQGIDVVGPSTIDSLKIMGYKRSGTSETDAYTWKSKPPLKLGFSSFTAPKNPVFSSLEMDDHGIPDYLNTTGFMPVDVFGEGIDGLLYTRGSDILYAAPKGYGKFAEPQTLFSFPNTHNFINGTASIVDLDGNGTKNLVFMKDNIKGFYKKNENNQWNNFQPFSKFPSIYEEVYTEHVSLSNNGKTDALIAQKEKVSVYESEGSKGYKSASQKIAPEGFPLVRKGYQKEYVGFANIFGDGLSHRIKISNGSLECWPSIGYGNFAPKIELRNVPFFEQDFSISRLYFADVDGTGTIDLVYVYEDHVALFINQNGNSFSDPINITLPEHYSDIDQISFMDLLGNGTTSLIFTKIAEKPRHYYYEFIGETLINGVKKKSLKPYLLNTIDNNLGLETQIEYCSSTKFYLEDKKLGTPWITKLPFPVQVVEKITSYERISGAIYSHRFKYHDGYYDPIARQFRGFGYVETWDTDEYEIYKKNAIRENVDVIESSNYSRGIYTRTWHHTGIPFENERIYAYYKQFYYQGDTEAYDFPESVFSDAIYNQDAETIRQAYTALKGQVLRTEVFGNDSIKNPALSKVPFTVSQSNVEVTLFQQKQKNKKAVFMVVPRESIVYNYERNPKDPRIEQNFVLGTDRYGNTLYSCAIYLPRRSGVGATIYPEQQLLKGTLQWEQFISPTQDFLYCHTSFEEQSFELYGLDLHGKEYFSFDTIKSQVDTLGLPNRTQIVPYGQAPSSGVQALQLTWNRTYFWDKNQTSALQLGKIQDIKLVHHIESAVMTKELSIRSFEGRLIDDTAYKTGQYKSNIIYTNGGYFYDQTNEYWWNKGLVQYYLKQPYSYYLPTTAENTFAFETQGTPNPQEVSLCKKTTLTYDKYFLRPKELLEILDTTTSNSRHATIDYYTLLPKEVIDINNNTTQLLFDELGMVVVTSLFGMEKGAPIGAMTLYDDGRNPKEYQPVKNPSFDDVIAHPNKYLQGASSYFFYDLEAWNSKTNPQPSNSIELIRNDYWKASTPNTGPYCKITIRYNDGLAREIEKKLKVDAGNAFVQNTAKKCVEQLANDRWQVSGRTVYNNKGKAFEQFNSYFTNTPYYEDQKSICVPPPTVTHYDALDREIKVETPKGFFSKISISPWEVKKYDQNDTVLDAPYFIDNYSKVSPEEKKALDQAIACYNTPAIEIYDNVGHVCFKIENNLGNIPKTLFKSIVKGTSITSDDIWNALENNGYLMLDKDHPTYNLAFLTAKFQPYVKGFALQLPSKFDALIDNITEVLLQHCLTEYYSYDITGRVKSSIDPRLYYQVVKASKPYYNFRYEYYMGEKDPVSIDSSDAGTQKHFNRIFGQLLWSWSPRSYCQLITYDAFSRRKKLWVKKITATGVIKKYTDFNLVETFDYGEYVAKSQENNLRGKVYKSQDLSGVIINSQYTMLEEIQHTSRQMVSAYKDAANWNTTVGLQKDIFVTEGTYNAVKQLLTETTPDGSITSRGYNQSGKLFSISLAFQGKPEDSVISEIHYDANDQRTYVHYGNGIKTTYEYEQSTWRLLSIISTKTSKGDTQNLNYTYDPVGNITNLIDTSIETVFHKNQKVNPAATYNYDRLYRLVKATGRQHTGINANTFKNNPSEGSFMQSIFGPPPSTNDANKLENYIESYSYDNSGNLTLKKHTAASGNWNRVLKVEDHCNRLLGHSYDASGNMRSLEINNPVNLSFNCCENMVKATIIQRPGMEDDSDYYLYDSNEIRTRKVSELITHGGTTNEIEDKIYLGNYEVVQNYSGSKESVSNIKLERQSLRVMDGDTCLLIVQHIKTDTKNPGKQGTTLYRYQFSNQLGSISLELDQSAQLISYEEYFPYGGTALITGTNAAEVALKEYRYSCKERDNSTGLYYYGARYYIPWMGRWLKPDPAGTIDGMNLYCFVRGNPISQKDRNGLSLSHMDLNPSFEELGQYYATSLLSLSKQKLEDKLEYAQTYLDTVESSLSTIVSQKAKATNTSFGYATSGNSRFASHYRRLDQYEDELFSTSSVREFYSGVGSKLKSSSSSNAQLVSDIAKVQFKTISMFRLPTFFSGYRMKSSSSFMQHPHKVGVYLYSAGTEDHYQADLERRNYLYYAMLDDKKTGEDGDTMLYTGLSEAINTSLDMFTAPSIASNIDVSFGSGFTQGELDEANEKREVIKELVDELNGYGTPSSTASVTGNDPWDGRYGRSTSLTRKPRRSASPTRR